MSVIERGDQIGYFLGEIPEVSDHDDEPMFHIEGDENDEDVFALCGYRFREGLPRRPLVRGIYDCEKCWDIYENLPDWSK